jgi:hypothetical protein
LAQFKLKEFQEGEAVIGKSLWVTNGETWKRNEPYQIKTSCLPFRFFNRTEKLFMPGQTTIERARQDAHEGKSPSTQAGEFVREEFHHIGEGKYAPHSAKQAIAIGLSKARRAGVKLPPPDKGKVSEKIRHQARRDYAKGQSKPIHT